MRVVDYIKNAFTSPSLKKESQKAGKDISRVQLQRTRQNIAGWRNCIVEAEIAYYPHRVKMMALFQDTVLNGHVEAVMNRRKDLSLLKDFEVCNDKGEVNEEATKFLKKKWFKDILSLTLDSIFYGYTLIQIGDIVNGDISGVTAIKRHHISPDRHTVGTFIYSLSGLDFTQAPYSDWTIWVETPDPSGVSTCGYGLLYKIAYYEIFIRNCMAYNGDFVELFAMPYRIGKTSTRDETMRAEMEATLRDMGSTGYAVIDPDDQIEFLETALGGTGYKAYDSFNDRLEKVISKIVLGHSSALDPTTGKLGSTEEAISAIKDKEANDGEVCENIVNSQVIPKLLALGFNMFKDGDVFMFKNDKEKKEAAESEDASNMQMSSIVKNLSDSGYEVDPAYITERTGIPVKKKEAAISPVTKKAITNQASISEKLYKIYGI